MKKKISILALLTSLFLILTSCNAQNSSTTNGADNPAGSSQYTEADITVSCSDLKSNLNEWHRYAIDVSHNTGQYLTAEIVGIVTDENGNSLGEKTVFVNNLGASPTDWLSVPFLAKNTSSEIYFDYEIVSYSFSDSWPEMPAISDENVSDYIRIETVDYGDVMGGELHVSVTVHNLTPQNFSGTLNFSVVNPSGEIICKDSESVSNLGPFGDREIILWVPDNTEYSVSYEVVDYSFSDYKE